MFVDILQTLFVFCLSRLSLRLFRLCYFHYMTFFYVPGVTLTDATTARPSGGVALLVRKELSPFVFQIHTEYDNVIILKLSSELLGTGSDVVLLGLSVPAANRVYHKETESTNGISLIEQCILNAVGKLGDLPLMCLVV